MSTGELDSPSGENDTARLGEIIDKRYRITGVLGRGGMGSVYRAEHLRIKRAVAIKLLHPAIRKISEVGKRFEREAFAAGRLHHPNCVTVSDFGELEDGTLYLVMELLPGETLEERLERVGAFSVQRSLHIVRHILRGLGHAHRAGIVHRDIKPANVVLVARDHDPDFARILDFGIAKLRGNAADAEGGEQLTRAGVAFGTPLYMSPEQAYGRDIDDRSDLYAAGIILFEMLTDRVPFDADDKLQILAMHASEPVPSINDVAPEASVPDEVEELIRRSMAKKPDARYASADEFLEAVEACMRQFAANSTSAREHALPAQSIEAVDGAANARRHMDAVIQSTRRTMLPTPGTPVQPVRPTQPGRPRATAPPARRARPRWLWPVVGAGIALSFVLVFALTASHGSGDDQRSVNLLQEYEHLLIEGKRCKDRKRAVAKLRELGDKRAIPALLRARKRLYKGGLLNLQTKNANWCLRRDAAEAARHLKRE